MRGKRYRDWLAECAMRRQEIIAAWAGGKRKGGKSELELAKIFKLTHGRIGQIVRGKK
jgi:DNA-directed RNA polymerase sigma subunit (sigma70/sigma32)